ncbi:hypothetical protein PCE1_000096 [Barthelona sp. PCE]
MCICLHCSSSIHSTIVYGQTQITINYETTLLPISLTLSKMDFLPSIKVSAKAESRETLFEHKAPSAKPKRTKNDQPQKKQFIDENLEETVVSFTNDNLQKGFLALGVVSDIFGDRLLVQLPCNTTAIVTADDFGDDFEEELERRETTIQDIYPIGTYLSCCVIDTEDGIDVSCDPSVINAGTALTDYVPKTNVWVRIESFEDLGVLFSVNKSVRGYAAYSDIAFAKDSIPVGSCMYLLVDSIGSVLKLKRGFKILKNPKERVSFDTIRPGAVINGHITAKTKNGISLNYFGFNGQVNLIYSDVSIMNDLRVHKSLTTTVIGVDTVERRLFCSSLTHIRNRSTPELPPISSILENVVCYHVTKNGAFGSTGDANVFLPRMKYMPQYIPDTLRVMVPVRVTTHNVFDGLCLVDSRDEVVKARHITAGDYTCGETVDAVVTEVLYDKLNVKIDNVKGSVTQMHSSDVPLSDTAFNAKFKKGMRIRCVVYDVGGKYLRLSMKKTLVANADKIPASFSALQERIGDTTFGVVTGIKGFGAFITFFGGVSGILPDTYGLSIGHIVKVRIVEVDADRGRVSLAPAKSIKAPISVGDAFKGLVTKIVEQGVFVKFANRSGYIPINHLHDFPAIASATHQSLQEGAPMEGVILRVDSRRDKITLSCKQTFISSFPVDTIEGLAVGQVMIGYVRSITAKKLFVGLGGELVGTVSAHTCNLPEGMTLDEAFMPHQTLIVSVKHTRPKLILSINPSVASVDLDSLIVQGVVEALPTPSFENFEVGAVFSGRVISTDETTFTFSPENDNMLDVEIPFALSHKLEVGSKTSVRVIHYDGDSDILIGTNTPELVKQPEEIVDIKRMGATIVYVGVSIAVAITAGGHIVCVPAASPNTIATHLHAIINEEEVNHTPMTKTDVYVSKVVDGIGYGIVCSDFVSDKQFSRVSMPDVADLNPSVNFREVNPDVPVEARITEKKGTYVAVALAPGVTGRLYAHDFDDFSQLTVGDVIENVFYSVANRALSRTANTFIRASDLIEGNQYKATVSHFSHSCVWFSFAGIKAACALVNMSSNVSVLSDVKRHFPIGSVHTITLLQAGVRQYDVTLLPEINEDYLTEGAVVPCQVTSTKSNGCFVQLPGDKSSRGFVSFTDFADDLTQDVISAVSKRSIHLCVLIKRNEALWQCSLRQSEISQFHSGEVPSNNKVWTLRNLGVGAKVRAVVKSVTRHGVYFVISRSIDAMAKFSLLSDARIAHNEIEKAFPVGSVHDAVVTRKKGDKFSISLKSADLQREYLTFSSLSVGQIISAVVCNVTDFGVFCFLGVEEMPTKKERSGLLTGLCHISNALPDEEQSPVMLQSTYKVGAPVKAKVVKLDGSKRTVSLGLKPELFSSEEIAQFMVAESDVEVESDDDADLFMESASKPEKVAEEPVEEEDSRMVAAFEDEEDDDVEAISMNMGNEDEDEDNQFESLNPAAMFAPKTASEKLEPEKARKGRREVSETRVRQESLQQDNSQMSADDYERLILSAPDSSAIWQEYCAHLVGQADIAGARALLERAIMTIADEEQDERHKIWIAMIHMELEFGDYGTLYDVYKRAKKLANHFKILESLTKIGLTIKDEYVFKKFTAFRCKKLGDLPESWIDFYSGLLSLQKEPEEWKRIPEEIEADKQLRVSPQYSRLSREDIFERALKNLTSSNKSMFMIRCAKEHYKLEDTEEGRAIFERCVVDFPKKTFVWKVYIEAEEKIEQFEYVRQLYQRVISLDMRETIALPFFKRYLLFEKLHGTKELVQQVKQAAAEYSTQFQ